MSEQITSASQLIDALSDFIPKLVGFSSMIAAFLPAPTKRGFFSNLHKLINATAFNFNKARNQP